MLVVDDEEPIRRLLARLLARRGYEVAEAKTVDEAFSLVQTFQPGLVIADVKHARRRRRDPRPAAPRREPGIEPGIHLHHRRPGARSRTCREELGQFAVLAKPFTASDLDVLLTQLAPVHAR